MDPAGATADFESQPGVMHTTTESQPEPSTFAGEPSDAHTPTIERTGTFRCSEIVGF